MLRADEPVSMGEIFDAVRDKRLTDEEAKEFLPEVYRNPEVLGAKAFGIDLRALAETQNAWSRRMELLADNFRQPYLASESLPLVDPQVAATREVRTELAGVADILRTTGEQIFSMAKLEASTVTNLELVHRETAALRGSLVEFKQQSATASDRLEALTRWLIAFTCAVVLLTVVLVVHDLTR